MQIHHFFAGLAVAVLGAGSPASAQEYHPENRGTYAEQMACTPDVFRLCGREIPDERRITACLRDNVPSLSRACRAVFASDTTATTRQTQPQPRQQSRDQYPRDSYQRDRDVPRDRENFDNDDPRRSPSYDNRRDRDDDD